MDALLEYLPYFNNPENNFYGILPNRDQLPFYNYSEEVIDFYQAFYHENMIQMFKGPEWDDETRKYFKNLIDRQCKSRNTSKTVHHHSRGIDPWKV